MSLLDSIFGTRSGKDAANPYLNQIPGVAHQGYDPYVNEGREASGTTKSTYEDLIKDPTGFINKLMQGYKPSEGYQFQKEQLEKELGNTAAAGGIAGTPLDQMGRGEAVQKLLSGDMQQFLQNVLGEFHTGLKGEEGIAERGYNATGKLTDTLGNALNQQGGLAFQDTQNKNQNTKDLWGIFGKALGGLGGLATQPALSLFGNKVWG
jgi:hypothetical protein